jgi:hypothetical protein
MLDKMTLVQIHPGVNGCGLAKKYVAYLGYGVN